MRDRIIEVMANALVRHDGHTWSGFQRPLTETQEDYLEAAAFVYAALQAEGMAVVPVEPTEAMLDNGGSSIIRPSIYMGGTPPGAKRRARDVWAAMLAAHTQEKDA